MRRDPDDPFDDFFREIERMMEDVMGFSGPDLGADAGTDDVHIDVHEYDDRVVVIADLPGVHKGAIDLKCDGRTLSVAASSDTREYADQLHLPVAVDETSASATYNNGVLEVEFDRVDDSADIDVQ